MPNRSGMRPEDAHRPSATPAPTASFTRLLDWIALRTDLSDLAVRTFWVLRAHVHETDTDPLVRVTDADLGAMIGKSEKTAQRARRQLEQAGLLDLVEQTTRRVRDPHTGRWMPRTTNVYRVIETPPTGYDGPLSPWDWRRRFRTGQPAGQTRGTDLSEPETNLDAATDTDDPPSTNPSQRTLDNESSVRDQGSTDRAPARETAPERTEPNTQENTAAEAAGASPAAPPTTPPSAWALGVLAPIPDAALYAPARDRAALAARLDALAATGVARADLERTVQGWEDTARPFAALTVRLASPQSVHTWNTRTPAPTSPAVGPFGGVGLGQAAGGGDMFAERPRFTLDSQGTAARTCPDHPAIRNIPGAPCRVCGRLCRTEPGELMHDQAPTGADPAAVPLLDALLGPGSDADAAFLAPKCGNERCNGDKDSPRYRTIIDATEAGDIVVQPCPACGQRRPGTPNPSAEPAPALAAA